MPSSGACDKNDKWWMHCNNLKSNLAKLVTVAGLVGILCVVRGRSGFSDPKISMLILLEIWFKVNCFHSFALRFGLHCLLQELLCLRVCNEVACIYVLLSHGPRQSQGDRCTALGWRAYCSDVFEAVIQDHKLGWWQFVLYVKRQEVISESWGAC